MELSDGTHVDARTVVWSAGVRPLHPTPPADLAQSGSERLRVDERFRLLGVQGVFVVGDLASFADDRAELPMLSPPAMQGARYVARMIHLGTRAGWDAVEIAEPFKYRDKGTMATIGRGSAVGVVRGIRFRGFPGWIAWVAVHLYYIIGFRNRVLVLAQWAWEYLRRDRPIRIVASSRADDVVGDLDE